MWWSRVLLKDANNDNDNDDDNNNNNNNNNNSISVSVKMFHVRIVIWINLVFRSSSIVSRLGNWLVRISDMPTRTPLYGGITIRCPRYNRDTEGGKTFLVTAAKLWNSLPINIRSSNSINASKQITILIL